MISQSVRLRYKTLAGLMCAGVSVVLSIFLLAGDSRHEAIWAAYMAGGKQAALRIAYPLDGAVFPPEIAAPTFRWADPIAEADSWLVWIEFKDGQDALSALASKNEWTPSDEQWELIKRRSLESEAKVNIVGINQAAQNKILSASSIAIGTSKDEVGSPLFYREVNLPFVEAVKDPTRIRWRFGEISSKTQPPIIMEKLPVCGNCHSFSTDGATLGMDVDYANDKGSYAISPVAEKMVLDKEKIITWSDYRKEDEKTTYGLLSQVSPDGRHVVSTVKDRSVFVPRPGLEFSQLFFPIRGILVTYRRGDGEFRSLPGADDPAFVQSNATWSPDGKTIVFARSKIHPLKTDSDKVLLTEAEAKEFLQDGETFLFDLYRIPFNDGKGGLSEPIQGASNNGMSNYFPKFSPDGKWLVFCKSKSFMLLQPDSELYIMPAEGGEPRRMLCNTSRMNSWHSWSPNGKWMVFSSKANGPYTQLWLTHIDQQGRSSRPVVLSRFTSPDRAANIPEFVNAKPDAIKAITQKFVDDHSYVRAGREFLVAGDLEGAERAYRQSLKLNPNNFHANDKLAALLAMRGKLVECVEYYRKAVEINPKNGLAHSNLGVALFRLKQNGPALKHVKIAVELDPENEAVQYNWANALLRFGNVDKAIEHFGKAVDINPKYIIAQYEMGLAYDLQGKLGQAIKQYSKVIEVDPNHIKAHLSMGFGYHRQGKLDQAIEHYSKVIELNPKHALSHNSLGVALGQKGRLDQAIAHFRKAVAANPRYAAPHRNCAKLLVDLGKPAQAVDQYQQAMDLDPKDIEAINSLALLLATCPNEGIRDGARAVELAKRACSATDYDVPQVMATLAAAYAEEGNFTKAVDTATKALQLVHPEQRPLADQIREQLEYYKDGKPYRLPQ